jgi:hypothetical protein
VRERVRQRGIERERESTSKLGAFRRGEGCSPPERGRDFTGVPASSVVEN